MPEYSFCLIVIPRTNGAVGKCNRQHIIIVFKRTKIEIFFQLGFCFFTIFVIVMPEKNILLNGAAKAGLVLGGVSVAGTLLSWVLGKIGGGSSGAAIAVSIANAVLWAAKFIACIYLMRLCMLRFSAKDPEADNSRVFRFGVLTSLLSAIVYSAFYMAYLMFIEPESINMALDILRENPMMDKNSLALIEEMAPMMPTYAFFSNLIYCFIYGTILSAILSRNIPPRNPFSGEDFNRK